MYMLQRVFRNTKALKLISGTQSNGIRNMYIVHAAAPRKKIGAAEKAVHFVVIAVSSFAYPFWVIYHIKEYQGEKK